MRPAHDRHARHSGGGELQAPGGADYDPCMIVRFDIRPDREGWTIYEPEVIDGVVAVRLTFEDADDLVDLLNTLDLLKRRPSLH
jgi:hypothetical protein